MKLLICLVVQQSEHRLASILLKSDDQSDKSVSTFTLIKLFANRSNYLPKGVFITYVLATVIYSREVTITLKLPSI